MLTSVKTPIRMFLGAIAGLSSVVAVLLIFVGFMPGIFGGSINPFWIILGLVLTVLFPFILGMTNVNWSRSLFISLIAPIAVIVLNGMFSGLSIDSATLFKPLLVSSTTLEIGATALALVGLIEIFTFLISKKRFLIPLISMGIGLIIVLSIDVIRIVTLQTVVRGPLTIIDSTESLVGQSYAFLSGANVVFLDDLFMRKDIGRFSPISNILFLGANLCVTILVIFITLNQ